MRSEDTDAKARALEHDVDATIDAVESLDEARILRSFLRVVRAVLAERMTYGATDDLDRVLMVVVGKRAEIRRAGWLTKPAAARLQP